MNSTKLFLILLFMPVISLQAFSQTPQKFKYQGICRDNLGVVVQNQAVNVRLSIHDITATGTIAYQETFSIITNQFGLITLDIGDGVVQQGVFSTIPWQTGDKFLEVEMDLGSGYVSFGATQLLSVPYALHSKTAESITGAITETDPVFLSSPANGIANTDITNWNTVYGWGNHSTAGYLISEVDGSVTNEIQTLSIGNDTIYLSNGGFVKLPAGFNGQYSSLTGAPTNVSSFTNDAGYLTSFTEVDGSITNEIQALSISNDTIYLSNGGFAKLPAGFNGQYSSLTGAPTNVSHFTNDAGYLTSFTEVDGSVTNELQALSISNDTIKLSSGGFVKLPAGFNGQYNSLIGTPTNVSAFVNDAGYLNSDTTIWKKNINNIYYNSGKVGLGTTNPGGILDVAGGFIRIQASDNVPTGNVNALEMGYFTTGGYAFLQGYNRGTGTFLPIEFSGNTVGFRTNGNTVMKILSNGNVGLGTTTPGVPLSVKSSGFGTGLSVHLGMENNDAIQLQNTNLISTINAVNETFNFANNGTNVITINNNNVGIGTTTPAVKFDVRGNAKFGTTSMINIWEWDAIEKIGLNYNTANGDFNMRNPVAGKRLLGTISATGSWGIETTAGNEMVRVTGSGNMGIGTISPVSILQLEKSGSSTGPVLTLSNPTAQASGTDSPTSAIDFKGWASASQSIQFRIQAIDDGSYSNHLAFMSKGQSSAGALTEKMRISSTGNVGMGTMTPNARLDLGLGYGTNGEKFLIYNDDFSGSLAGTKTGFYLDRFSLQNNATFVFPTSAVAPGSYMIAVKNTSSTILVPLMTILGESGNVGIGTTTPAAKLDVVGDLRVSGSIYSPGMVVQTIVKTSEVTCFLNTTTFTEANTDYRISIVPKFANSIFLIEYSFSVNTAFANNTIFQMQLIRDIGSIETPVGVGPVNGTRNQTTFSGRTQGYDINDVQSIFLIAKDQGLTVGNTYTYGFKYHRETGGGGTCYFNYSNGDSAGYGFSGIMTMKITEIAQ